MADFTEESDHLAHITKVIIHLLSYMEENPVSYPPAMMVYTTLRFGLIPTINVVCDHDSECQVSAGSPCGGLDDVLVALDEAYECIDLEMDFEVPACSDPHLPDYDI